VVETAELAGSLDRRDVCRLFDDTSRQIVQVSCSLTLPQMEQKRTLSRTSIRICASRVVSKLWVCKMWNAMRCADFGPMPGRRPSSSMSS
jgi:hypothetical protein